MICFKYFGTGKGFEPQKNQIQIQRKLIDALRNIKEYFKRYLEILYCRVSAHFSAIFPTSSLRSVSKIRFIENSSKKRKND